LTLRVIFFGTPDFATVSLAALLNGPDDVVGLICQADRPAGRGQKLRMPATKELDLAHGVPVHQPTRIRNREFEELLRGWDPDVIVVVAYGRILPTNVLELPHHGCINVHASLLPKYRGAAPVQWAIARGETETGVTIMRMSEEMDAGGILLQRSTAIGELETAGELSQRLAQLGAAALMDTMPRLRAGHFESMAQDHAAVTLAPLIRKTDGEIDWTRPAVEIARLCRAFHPWPSAYSHVGGKLLKIHRARALATPATDAPGSILDVGDTVDIATGEGTLAVNELQVEGRKRLPARDFARGGTLRVGIRLDNSTG